MNRTKALPTHAAAMTALIVLLLSLGCQTSIRSSAGRTAADSESLEALIMTMGERLAVMPLVAEWKRAHERPVRDRAREGIVLDDAVSAVRRAAQDARTPGLPEAAVRRFYQAQIDAAVDIQEEVLSRPARASAGAPDLPTVIRPRLDRLGTRIADLLVVQGRPPDRLRLQHLAQTYWRIDGLTPETQERLIVALEALLSVRSPARSPRP